MVISHKLRFIFLHNPKCAGTSFRDALKPYHDDHFNFWGIFYAPYFKNHIDHTHLRLWEMQAQFPKIFSCLADYNSLIFVRDPYARFLSALNEHMKKFQPNIKLLEMDTLQRIGAIEAFILNELTIARITTDWRFIHFSPQLWYLRLGEHTIPRHIVAIRNGHDFIHQGLACLGLPALPVPHHNPSPVDLTGILASPVITGFIHEFYRDDLAYFAAAPALAPMLTTPRPPAERTPAERPLAEPAVPSASFTIKVS